METYYSASKAGAERLANAFADQKKKPILNVRPYSIYGEGEANFRFIPTVCRCIILGEELSLDPEPVHDWVYVEDFIDVLLSNLNLESRLIEIGTGIGTSNQRIVEILSRIAKKPIKTKVIMGQRNYDNHDWIYPTSELQYKMKHSLDTGLFNTYKYYEKQFGN